MTEEQKILKILNDLNSSQSYESEIKKEVKDNISDITKSEIEDTYNSYNSESTMDTTIKSLKASLKTSYYDYSDEKGRFWIKNNYYDISNIGKNSRKGLEAILIRDKTKEHFAFLYIIIFQKMNQEVNIIIQNMAFAFVVKKLRNLIKHVHQMK